jgi:lysophospholipase L1-like esterase
MFRFKTFSAFFFFLALTLPLGAFPFAGSDSIPEDVKAFRAWAYQRVPDLRVLEGKINTAIVPTAKEDNKWWMGLHARHLEEAGGKKKNTRLVFLGNSITQALEKPDNLRIWNRFFGKYDPLLLGISGDRTENVLWRIEHGELDGIHPELLVLLIGTNNTDAKHYPLLNSGTEVGEGIARICYEVRKKLPETKILILAIFPFGKDPANKRRAENAEASRLAAQLADGQHIFFADLNDHFLYPDQTIDPSVMPDYLHPSVAGNWIWGKALYPVVEELMQGK